MPVLGPIKTRLIRSGNSLAVRLPKSILDQVGLHVASIANITRGETGPEVELRIEAGEIIIRPVLATDQSWKERAAQLIEKMDQSDPDTQEKALDLLAALLAGRADRAAQTASLQPAPTAQTGPVGEVRDAASAGGGVAEARHLLVSVTRFVYERHVQEMAEYRKRGLALFARPDALWLLLFGKALGAGDWKGIDWPRGRTDRWHHAAELSYTALERYVQTMIEPERGIARLIARWFGRPEPEVEEPARRIVEVHRAIQRGGGLEVQTSAFRQLSDPASLRQFMNELEHGDRERDVYWREMQGLWARTGGPQGTSALLGPLFHPLLERHIVVGSAVLGLSKRLRLDFGTAKEEDVAEDDAGMDEAEISKHEAFYLQVAREAGVEPWEMDWLLDHGALDIGR